MITVQVCVRICAVCQQVVLVTLFEVVARRVGPACFDILSRLEVGVSSNCTSAV